MLLAEELCFEQLLPKQRGVADLRAQVLGFIVEVAERNVEADILLSKEDSLLSASVQSL